MLRRTRRKRLRQCRFQGETGKPGTALAYEHRVGIRLSAARIDAQLAASRDACNSERFGQCDVLAIEQRGGIGHYAELTVRIVPDGVEKLVAAAAEGGTLESRQTRAEDLAQAVADTRQQRERLQREYQTLQQYQGRKDMSVGDLLALAKKSPRWKPNWPTTPRPAPNSSGASPPTC